MYSDIILFIGNSLQNSGQWYIFKFFFVGFCKQSGEMLAQLCRSWLQSMMGYAYSLKLKLSSNQDAALDRTIFAAFFLFQTTGRAGF